MAVVKGVKEKVHLPLYDAVLVPPGRQLRDVLSSSVLRFFVNVHGKTKLETNMQSASLLPHWNTFEARALRVVVSDLPPVFPRRVEECLAQARVPEGNGVSDNGGDPAYGGGPVHDLHRLLMEACDDLLDVLKRTTIERADSDQVQALVSNLRAVEKRGEPPEPPAAPPPAAPPPSLEACLGDPAAVPLPAQLDGSRSHVLGALIYGSVTSFVVGEKVMIQMPTWFFPAGGGPYSEDGSQVTHGVPSPEATFRFAEPIQIDTQQSFRVEIEVPEHRVLADLQRLYGPLAIWVVLDGYMTRDVQ